MIHKTKSLTSICIGAALICTSSNIHAWNSNDTSRSSHTPSSMYGGSYDNSGLFFGGGLKFKSWHSIWSPDYASLASGVFDTIGSTDDAKKRALEHKNKNSGAWEQAVKSISGKFVDIEKEMQAIWGSGAYGEIGKKMFHNLNVVLAVECGFLALPDLKTKLVALGKLYEGATAPTDVELQKATTIEGANIIETATGKKWNSLYGNAINTGMPTMLWHMGPDISLEYGVYQGSHFTMLLKGGGSLRWSPFKIANSNKDVVNTNLWFFGGQAGVGGTYKISDKWEGYGSVTYQKLYLTNASMWLGRVKLQAGARYHPFS